MKRYNNYLFKMEENECWYGGIVDDGIKYPVNKDSIYECDLEVNESSNQAVPILISNKGRYIWSESGFKVKIQGGEIEILTS